MQTFKQKTTKSIIDAILLVDKKLPKSGLRIPFRRVFSEIFRYREGDFNKYADFKWKNILMGLFALIFFILFYPLLKLLHFIFQKTETRKQDEELNKSLPDDIYTTVSKAMTKTWKKKNPVHIENFLSDDVVYVMQGFKTIKGKINYINFLKDKFKRDKANKTIIYTKITFSDYYNHAAVLMTAAKTFPTYQLFRIENEKITHIALASLEYRDWNEDFDHCINDKIEPQANKLPCLTCGILSEDLTWIHYKTPPEKSGPLRGYQGELSVCPECEKIVNFKTTIIH